MLEYSVSRALIWDINTNNETSVTITEEMAKTGRDEYCPRKISTTD